MRQRISMKALGFLMLVFLIASLRASAPVQFEVWGTAGPALPAAPAGWREDGPPLDASPLPAATAAEQRRGCLVFARDPFDEVGPGGRPAGSERVAVASSFTTPGEYEPVTLAIHVLEDMPAVRVGIEALQAGDGSTIPADHIELRVVRNIRVPVDAGTKTFQWRPFLLERQENFALAKSRTVLLWLTVKVPEAAAPGDYRGMVSIQPEGKELTSVQVRLKVLPFTLPPAPIEMGIYYPRPAELDHLLVKELTDIREHGLSPPIPAMEVQIASRDRVFGDDDVAATRAHCDRVLRAERQVFGPWRFPLTFEAGHQITHAWDATKNWFTYWPHQPEIETDLAKAIQVVADAARAQGVASLRAYLIDEGGAHNLLDEAVYYKRFVKERFPQVATTTTIGGGIALGHDEIGRLSTVVDFLSANRFTPEIARTLSAQGKPFGLYNGAGSTPAGVRFFFGFHGWKSGAGQIAQWCYSFGEAVFQGIGLRQEDEGYVYHAADGPLPSFMWEAVREGVDDYRYVDLLWRMIDAAKASSDTRARSAANDAERVLMNILGQIGWGFQALQSGDRTPPPHPSTLRKWRWQVAQQVKLLCGFTPASLAGPAGRRPGALDLPWRELPKEALQFGPEILLPSDFESGLKPWRVEASNGQGQGELVRGSSHGGQQAVRIVVPAASGSSAVTVLVWPQYGDGKLDLRLDGGRVYEFAAWAKWQDRGVPPELRVNVPASAVVSSRTGQDRARADGWQRLWTRLELKTTAQPTYLAVWVQGPGTVWLDDLSLREVTMPALTVSLDQGEYDASDRTTSGLATAAKRVKPTQIRVSLTSAEGPVLDTVTVPFASGSAAKSDTGRLAVVILPRPDQCRFWFNPSALAPGRYACQVALLDSAGQAIAERNVPFERNLDRD